MDVIRIFVSSTFKDMDAERDIVANFIKPRVEQKLALAGVVKSIEIIDLRWGVNTQDYPDEERESLVLRRCIENIRSSRPYFIGFIGSRYGWIPPEGRWRRIIDELSDEEIEMMGNDANEVKSVTELEILFGALKDHKSLPYSFFLFRNSDVYDSMDSKSRTLFCDSDPVMVGKLEQLKQKISTAYSSTGYEKNIMKYDCSWDGKRMHVDETAMKAVADTIAQSILFTERQEHSMETELDLLVSEEIKDINETISRFAGRRNELDAICNLIDHDGSPMMIVAPDGCGKTSLVSALYAILSQSPDKYVPFIHLTQMNGPMAPAEVMLKKWLWQMGDASEGRCHINMESDQMWLLLKFMESLDVYKDKKVVLIIDNAQYLRGLNEILSMPGLFDRVCLIMTSDRKINLTDFCEQGKLFGLPLFSPDEALEFIDRYTDYYNKTLPRDVVKVIAEKAFSDGELAMCDPLWTTLLLHHLINIDVDDYEEMRRGHEGDEADKITQFFIDRVQAVPCSSRRFVYWLDHNFAPQGQYNIAHELILAAESGMDIGELKKKLSETLPYYEQKLRSALKELSPLIYVDSFTDRLNMRYPYLFADKVEPLALESVPFDVPFFRLIATANRLALAADILERNQETVAASLCRDEAQRAISCFDAEAIKEYLDGEESLPNLSRLSLDRQQNFPETFYNAYMAYGSAPSWDNKICLEILYYLWCSQVEYLTHYIELHGADKDGMIALEQSVSRLREATGIIRCFTSRNMVSYMGEGLYLSSKEYLARMIYRNEELSQSCLAQAERIYRCMWYAVPYNSTVARSFAIALDGTTLFCPSLMEERNSMSVALFEELYKRGEASLEDLLTALQMGITVSKVQGDYDKIIQKCDDMIKRHLAGAVDDIELLRFYAIALDYKSEAYALKRDFDKAFATVKEAYDCLAKDYEHNPHDAIKLHSIIMNLEKQVRYGIFTGNAPQTEIFLYLRYCHAAIESNPGDAFAHKELAVGEVLALYISALLGDLDFIQRRLEKTFDLLRSTVISSQDYRIANAPELRATIQVLQESGHADLASAFKQLYQNLATDILGMRLAPTEYFYP